MNKKRGFTIIEMIISIILFSLIIVLAFDVMGNIWISKTKLSNKIDVNQDLYSVIEMIVNNIKDFNWNIDYEEYWNRYSIWMNTSSGHYVDFSWYGNYWSWWNFATNTYWDGFYFCRSWIWVSFWTWWCLTWFNSYWDSSDVTLQPQRFWQFAFQFIDYNSNFNNDTAECVAQWKPWMDLWDEDCDWKIRWDDDDESIWLWPVAFSGNEVKELYLIRNWKINERLFMRYNIKIDPFAPAWYTCDSAWTWSWCIWNIQILKLVWKDLWLSHSWSVSSSGQYDWVIDTWKCNDDYNCNWADNIPNSTDDWWIDLLPEYINVKKLKLFVYPNTDYKYAWKSENPNLNINSYIRLTLNMWYSWERRKKIKWDDPTISITTSINLNNN